MQPHSAETSDLTWQAAGAVLKRDGITVAPELFAAEADYLRAAYIEGTAEPGVSAHEAVIPVSAERGARVGNTVWKYVSLTDPAMTRLLLHPELLEMIHSYYGSQPYFRRLPFVKRTTVQPHHETDISSVYHIDQARHFVGIMMLLSDLGENQSHMRYLVGTHRQEQADARLKPNDPRNRELDTVLEKQYQVYRLVGPKGTMFIYDNGNGIHKGNMVVGTTRDVMQATFSRGDHVAKPSDLELRREALVRSVADRPPIVRTAIQYIL